MIHQETRNHEAAFLKDGNGLFRIAEFDCVHRHPSILKLHVFAVVFHPVAGIQSIYPLKDTGHPSPQDFDTAEGFGRLPDSELVFGISQLDGKAMPQDEIAILLEPGESVTFEFFFPHSPIPQARARELAKRDFQDCLNQCRNFWNNKLQAAGKFILPEKRIDQMTSAGLLHLDMVTYGQAPSGALNASVT